MIVVVTAQEYILEILERGTYSTSEIVEELRSNRSKLSEEICLDRVPSMLVELRKKGKIKGKYSPERREYLWELA